VERERDDEYLLTLKSRLKLLEKRELPLDDKIKFLTKKIGDDFQKIASPADLWRRKVC